MLLYEINQTTCLPGKKVSYINTSTKGLFFSKRLTSFLFRTKKEKDKLKRTSERLQRDKEQLETSSKKFKKKMESYRTKLTEAETENNKVTI